MIDMVHKAFENEYLSNTKLKKTRRFKNGNISTESNTCAGHTSTTKTLFQRYKNILIPVYVGLLERFVDKCHSIFFNF